MSELIADLKAKTVEELFEGHEFRWCKRALFRNFEYRSVESKDQAVQCCLSGAIQLVYPEEKIGSIIYKLARCIGSENVIDASTESARSIVLDFNDNYYTNFEDVLAVVKKAKI